jgi:hypothetical protein
VSVAGTAAGGKGGGSGTGSTDYDPTIDIALKVTIVEVWEMDMVDAVTDLHDHNPADFYWTVNIESVSWTDPRYSGSDSSYDDRSIWDNRDHITPGWSFTQDIDDFNVLAWVRIALYDYDPDSEDDLCDISPDPGPGTADSPDGANVELVYRTDFGRPAGDDEDRDRNGVWHVSGTQDGSGTTDENDCDLWYSITQVDKTTGRDRDGDGIPWYMEKKVYGSSPTSNDIGRDFNFDGIPIEYEYKYALSGKPNNPNNVLSDYDNDGLDLREESRFSHCGCAPDYPNVLVEIDYMEGHGPYEWALEYVSTYYLGRVTPNGYAGARIFFEVHECLTAAEVDPNGNGYTDDGTWQDWPDEILPIFQNHFNADFKGGAWHWCLFCSKTCEPEYGGGWQQSDCVGLTKIGALPRPMTIFDKPIDDWCNMNVWNPARVQAGALMHELAHCFNVVDWVWAEVYPWQWAWTEDYCSDPNCVMSLLTHDSIDWQDPSLYYCAHHWSQVQVGVALSQILEPPPDP